MDVVSMIKKNILVQIRFAFFLSLLVFYTVASAETISLSNGDFETGGSSTEANDWDEIGANTYYLSGSGFDLDDPNIDGRAAIMWSRGIVAIQQTLTGVQGDDYDQYEVLFTSGYRNDYEKLDDIYPFRISIWDITNDVELAGADICISEADIDSNTAPNAGMIITRRIILNVDRAKLSNEQIALRFHNKNNAGEDSDHATAVVDNVSINGYKCISQWNFENDLTDTVGDHNGTGINSPDYTYGGIKGTTTLALDSNSSQVVTVPYSSELCSNNFTVIAWAKIADGSNDTSRILIANRKGSPANGYLVYAGGDNKWTFKTYGDSGDDLCKSDNANVVEDQWAFIVASFEQTGTDSNDLIGIARLYIDGILTKTVSGVCFKPNSSQSLSIGAAWSGSYYYNYYDGLIDDIHVYDYVLDELEIANLYAKGTQTLKVMSYNINFGASLSNIADVISMSGADVIGLSEVEIAPSYNQAELLADELHMYCCYGISDTNVGNAIISKFPIISSENYELPVDGACVVAQIDMKDERYSVFATQLSSASQATRIEQAEYILDIANSIENKKVLLGSMESTTSSDPIAVIQKTFKDAFNLSETSVTDPVGRTDYVFASSDFGLQTNYSEVIDNSYTSVASDHDPVLAEFMEPAAEPNVTIRVMSYNILQGGYAQASWRYTEDRWDMLISVIKNINPDILFLQECVQWTDSGNTKLREFASRLDMPYTCIATTHSVHKTAVLSKYPITYSYWLPEYLYLYHNITFADVLISPNYKLKVASQHFGWWGDPDWSWSWSYSTMVDRYQDQKTQLMRDMEADLYSDFVIGGDWNHTADGGTGEPNDQGNLHDDLIALSYINTLWEFNPTDNPIDSVYMTSSEKLEVLDSDRVSSSSIPEIYYASDHLPVWADIRITLE